ncbi:prolyl-tRNA synthetase associated domain-containing protein [Blastomonas aquatica]|uniref:DNA-binding protein n=1 Tax=Blastomonas aquatica TaxID=1510276 RepID=A0ABQ1JH10_9SPHN|nr:prolyl-tRNA synthetase associated domain-containing protein [Blastomonas aquatica]GGB66085.1 DNA-binding protein [Blastomonas aquatica]
MTDTSAPSDSRLHKELASAGIAFDQVDHDAVFTVLESSALERGIPGAHTKNLFLKDASGQFYLVTVLAEKQVDLGALRHLVGAARFSFGSADEMAELLGVTPGSVTPLAAINDTRGRVQLVLDEVLAAQPRVNVHPLRNTATLGLSGLDLVRMLVRWRHAPLIVPVPNKRPAAEPSQI